MTYQRGQVQLFHKVEKQYYNFSYEHLLTGFVIDESFQDFTVAIKLSNDNFNGSVKVKTRIDSDYRILKECEFQAEENESVFENFKTDENYSKLIEISSLLLKKSFSKLKFGINLLPPFDYFE